MIDVWVTPDAVFDGQRLLRDVSVRVVNNRIQDVADAKPRARKVSGCLTPGFVDLQVNGGGGVLLNTTPTVAGMETIAAAHRRLGTVAIMPTVITDHPDVLDAAAHAALDAKGCDGIVGLHIEGPHISLARRGTHNADYIRPLDDRTLDVVDRLRRNDVSVMITLAPEAATETQIATLAGLGAVVSLGHTDASAEDVEAAIKAGATCATHLFNAMSPMTSRAPGAVGGVLNSHVRSGMICDGHHVDDRMIQLALRARPAPDLTFLVSDAMATVGGPDQFDLYGKKVRLTDGQLTNEEGNLAGAHVTQAEGVARLVHQIGVPLETALRMALSVPADVIGQPGLATLQNRLCRDLIVLPDDPSEPRPFDQMLAATLAKDAAE